MLDTQAQEAKQSAPLAPPTPTLPEAADLLERNMIGQTLLPFFPARSWLPMIGAFQCLWR